MKCFNNSLSLVIASALCFLFINSCNDTYQQEPVVYTYQVADSNVTATTAKLSGQIQILGTQQINEYGIEVYKNNLTSTPIVRKRNIQATTDTFTFIFDSLAPNTLYYYWAYARINTAHVYSQDTPHFTTKVAK